VTPDDLTAEEIRDAAPEQVDEWIGEICDERLPSEHYLADTIDLSYTRQWAFAGPLLEELQIVDWRSLHRSYTSQVAVACPHGDKKPVEPAWFCGPTFRYDSGVDAFGVGETGPEAIARAWLRAWAEGLVEADDE